VAKTTSIIPNNFTPFDGIGLCFSGGGYRATFFDLGVVAYLNRIQYEGSPLLDKVIALSSVSGGTLLAVAFAKAAQESTYTFNSFYRTFYDAFTPENDLLLKTAIHKLEDPEVWKKNPYKKRSLINAFALTYSEMPLFEGGFDIFENPKSKTLKRVCFNSTEFSYGLIFRFQNTGVFGNGTLRSSELNAIKNKIQLGDIVASSSCFPMGFEPLVFPDDYIKDQDTSDYKALKQTADFKTGVGIMDGGIADNQGIKSMLNISRLKDVRDHFNLLIVNDVSSYKMEPWKQDVSKLKNKTMLKVVLARISSYFRINPLYVLPLVIGIALVFMNFMHVFAEESSPLLNIIGGFLTGVGLLLTIFGVVSSRVKEQTMDTAKNFWKQHVPEALQSDVLSFENLGVGLLKRMLVDRMSSTFIMVYDVFLKQIRRLNYEILYMLEELDHKRMTSTVYELNGKESPYKSHTPHKEILPASVALTAAALIASECPTTLWWSKDDIALNRMENLVACGQFTTCYSLLVYLLELKNDGIESPELQALQLALEKDWTLFNKDPLRWV
jgi:hypothetical protein